MILKSTGKIQHKKGCLDVITNYNATCMNLEPVPAVLKNINRQLCHNTSIYFLTSVRTGFWFLRVLLLFGNKIRHSSAFQNNRYSKKVCGEYFNTLHLIWCTQWLICLPLSRKKRTSIAFHIDALHQVSVLVTIYNAFKAVYILCI